MEPPTDLGDRFMADSAVRFRPHPGHCGLIFHLGNQPSARNGNSLATQPASKILCAPR